MYDMPETSILLIDDHWGIYIPKHFHDVIRHGCVSGVDNEQWAVLESGPDHEFYWEVWDDVLSNAIVTEPGENGPTSYYLWQDGDLWLVPVGVEWPDE